MIGSRRHKDDARRGRARQRVARALRVSLLLGAFAAAQPAHAEKVQDLSRALSEDGSYKVRVQAALLLGKLGDRNAVPALERALRDENNTVRAIAAQALGRLGAPEAAASLRGLLGTERDAFVRTQAEKALAALTTETASKKRIYLTIGPFSGGTRQADSEALGILRSALQRELGKLSAVTFTLEPGVDERAFARTGRVGFLIDGNVTRLDDGQMAGGLETNCDVKVMVARWPSKSIILWTNAGAAVQGGSRARDRENARRDCLEASAGQLSEDLSKFFQAQGG